MANADDGPSEDEADEWRFSLEDIERRAEGEADDDEETDGNIAGSFAPSGELEPGDIDLENALFVVLGVVATLLTFLGFYLMLAV